MNHDALKKFTWFFDFCVSINWHWKRCSVFTFALQFWFSIFVCQSTSSGKVVLCSHQHGPFLLLIFDSQISLGSLSISVFLYWYLHYLILFDKMLPYIIATCGLLMLLVLPNSKWRQLIRLDKCQVSNKPGFIEYDTFVFLFFTPLLYGSQIIKCLKRALNIND